MVLNFTSFFLFFGGLQNTYMTDTVCSSLRYLKTKQEVMREENESPIHGLLSKIIFSI